MALGDLSRPMRRSAHDRGRLAVEDVYAGMWQRMKRELCGGDAEAAKHMIRQEGCSAYFMSAIHSITTTNVGYNPRSRDDQAQRFSVALRLAVHLSPDNGAAIYEQLDNALCTKRHPYSLAIVNAYLAFKAHQYEANRL